MKYHLNYNLNYYYGKYLELFELEYNRPKHSKRRVTKAKQKQIAARRKRNKDARKARKRR